MRFDFLSSRKIYIKAHSTEIRPFQINIVFLNELWIVEVAFSTATGSVREHCLHVSSRNTIASHLEYLFIWNGLTERLMTQLFQWNEPIGEPFKVAPTYEVWPVTYATLKGFIYRVMLICKEVG
jgi:hypothetical protein